MAKLDLNYFAECIGRRHHWTFTVWVSADKVPRVNEIIAWIRNK